MSKYLVILNVRELYIFLNPDCAPFYHEYLTGNYYLYDGTFLLSSSLCIQLEPNERGYKSGKTHPNCGLEFTQAANIIVGYGRIHIVVWNLP